jgi:hypothetical protein
MLWVVQNQETSGSTLASDQVNIYTCKITSCDKANAKMAGQISLRGTASRLKNVLWNGFLTPEGSEGVPNDLRILHVMIALLQENKIRKREVSISTYTS